MDSFGCTLTLWVHTGEAEAWSEDAWETELPALQATTSWALNSTQRAHNAHKAQCAFTKRHDAECTIECKQPPREL